MDYNVATGNRAVLKKLEAKIGFGIHVGREAKEKRDLYLQLGNVTCFWKGGWL